MDERGLPPTDESRDVDLNQLEWNLRLTPAERLRQIAAIREFSEAARLDRIRRYDSTLQILDRLNRSGVPYVLIGGAAPRVQRIQRRNPPT